MKTRWRAMANSYLQYPWYNIVFHKISFWWRFRNLSEWKPLLRWARGSLKSYRCFKNGNSLFMKGMRPWHDPDAETKSNFYKKPVLSAGHEVSIRLGFASGLLLKACDDSMRKSILIFWHSFCIYLSLFAPSCCSSRQPNAQTEITAIGRLP